MPSTEPDGTPFRLLFVCSGNTCRSPLAEALARREVERLGWGSIEVASAGTSTVDGLPASEGSLKAAERHGLDLSTHRSSELTRERVEAADLVLAMSVGHLMRVIDLGGEGRVALLGAFADGSDDLDMGGVPDPFGGDDETYEETFGVLEDLVTRCMRRLEPILAP